MVVTVGNICLYYTSPERVVVTLAMLALEGQCTIVRCRVSKPFAVFVIGE